MLVEESWYKLNWIKNKNSLVLNHYSDSLWIHFIGKRSRDVNEPNVSTSDSFKFQRDQEPAVT